MANFTSHLNQETIKLSTCSLSMEDSEGAKYIFNPYFFASVNVILSVTSLSGNILILAALPKVLSLHPPSKLLFQCLSCTDLFVGLLSQPLFITYLATISNKNWEHLWNNRKFSAHFMCYTVWRIYQHVDCNKRGQTSRSVAEVKVQAGC